jgi:hypothetical protein
MLQILGLIPVKAPESAVGDLDITFLDTDDSANGSLLRISRGNKSNLFILRMQNPNVKP